MQAVLDHISAVLVGATVLLLVGTISRSSLDAALGGGEHHAARAEEVALASYLTHDLRNVGAAGADDPIVSGSDGSLEIEAPVRRGDSAATVRYERVSEHTADGETIYRVERYVDGDLTTTFEDLAKWRVVCLDANGDTLSYGGTAYKDDTRAFGVELTVAPGAGESSLGAGTSIRRRWATTIHPFHLDS